MQLKTTAGWRQSMTVNIVGFVSAFNRSYGENITIEDLFSAEPFNKPFDLSDDRLLNEKEVIERIWIYFSTQFYDACQGLCGLDWTGCVKDAGSHERVYVTILTDLFQNPLLAHECHVSSSFECDHGEKLAFNWQGVDYSWIFGRKGETVDTDVYTKFFSLMEQTTPTRWHWTFDTKNGEVVYGAIPKTLSDLIGSHFGVSSDDRGS